MTNIKKNISLLSILVISLFFLIIILSISDGLKFDSSSQSAAVLSVLRPPTNVSAKALSTKSIEIDWTNNEPSAKTVKIERSKNGGSWSNIASVVPLSVNGSQSYINGSLSTGVLYSYRLRVYTGQDYSVYSAVTSPIITSVSLPPPTSTSTTSGGGNSSTSTPSTIVLAPSNLYSTSVSSSNITLKWNDNSSNEAAFIVERSSGGGTFVVIGSTTSNVNMFYDSDLSESTTYSYRVKAVASDMTASSYSNTSSATTLSFIQGSQSCYAAFDLLEQSNGAGGVTFSYVNGTQTSIKGYFDGDIHPYDPQRLTDFVYVLKPYDAWGTPLTKYMLYSSRLVMYDTFDGTDQPGGTRTLNSGIIHVVIPQSSGINYFKIESNGVDLVQLPAYAAMLTPCN